MDDKQKLRQKLHDKLIHSNMNRKPKQTQKQIFEKNLKKMGVDQDRLEKDIKAVHAQGGFSIDLNKSS